MNNQILQEEIKRMNRITRTPPTSYTLFRFFFTKLKQGCF